MTLFVKSKGLEQARLRPPAPVPLEKTPRPLGLVRGLRASPIACFTKAHYELPFVLTRSFLGNIAVVNDAAAICRVLADNAANYRKDNLWQRMLAPAVGQGLLTTEVEQWRAQRHLIASLFTSRMISGFAPAMAASANAMVKRWFRHDDCRLDISVEMARVAIAVLESTLFADGIGSDPDEFARAATHYLDRMGRLDPLDVLELPGWLPRLERLRVRPALAVFDRVVATVVEKRRTLLACRPDSAPNDLLTTLLTAGEKVGHNLSNSEIRANIITFILAGYESTANALTWSLFLLSLAPEWRARVEAEVDRELPDACYIEGSLQRLMVTRAVLEEAMRLYPPIPIINRQAIGPDRLADRDIAAETRVVIAPWVVHRHTMYWEAPDLFDPARFLPGARERMNRLAYLPFGFGPRACIAGSYSMQAAIIVLATIVRSYRMELVAGHEVWPKHRITLRPHGGLPMILRHRRTSP